MERFLRMLVFGLGATFLGCAWISPLVAGEGANDNERSRQVWEQLSEQERSELRARYERFQKLSPKERERMQARMETLRLLRTKALASMSVEQRKHFESLDREEQHRLLENAVRNEMRRRGGRIRGKLPREWVNRLQDAEPAERERMLDEFVRTTQRSKSERMLRSMAKRLELSSNEVEELRRLPWQQRRVRMLEMRRAELNRRVEREGHPPPGITTEEWERWKQLPTTAFFEVWFQAMPRHGRGSRFPERPRLEPATARAVLDELEIDWRAHRRDMPDLPRDELRQRMAEHTSQRVLIVLELSGELAPSQLEHLRGLEHSQLRQAARRIAEMSLSGGAER